MSVQFNLHVPQGSDAPISDLNVGAGSQSDSSSGDDDDDNQDWDDLVPQTCQSLFDDTTFPSVKEVLAYDKARHDFDLFGTYARLCSCTLFGFRD
jgi:hypothetical protein